MSEKQFEVNAAWELREGRSICRWFCAWKIISDNEIAGTIAGYGGGGCFEVERFYAQLSSGELSSLWIDFTDRISDEEIEFDSLGEKNLGVCEDALDLIWDWNDHDEWEESDCILLLEDKKGELQKQEDMFYLRKGNLSVLRDICEKASLTAGPS